MQHTFTSQNSPSLTSAIGRQGGHFPTGPPIASPVQSACALISCERYSKLRLMRRPMPLCFLSRDSCVSSRTTTLSGNLRRRKKSAAWRDEMARSGYCFERNGRIKQQSGWSAGVIGLQRPAAVLFLRGMRPLARVQDTQQQSEISIYSTVHSVAALGRWRTQIRNSAVTMESCSVNGSTKRGLCSTIGGAARG